MTRKELIRKGKKKVRQCEILWKDFSKREKRFWCTACFFLVLLFFIAVWMLGVAPMLPVKDPFGHSQRLCSIDAYGASKTNSRETREAFAKAFLDCSSGGTVVVPRGIWKTGGITIPSETTLLLSLGAKVIFSDNPNDYLPAVPTRWEGMDVINYQPLIYIPEAKNVAIIGRGTFVGNGEQWWKWRSRNEGMDENGAAKYLYEMTKRGTLLEERIFGSDNKPLRPSFLEIYNSENVVVEGMTFLDGPMWTIHPVYSKRIVIRDVEVQTTGPNTDGVVIDSSEDVVVEKCVIGSGDDAVAIKSGLDYDGWRKNIPSRDVVVRDNTIIRGNGGVTIGSEISGGVENVRFENLNIVSVDTGIRLKTVKGRGGYVRNIRYENIRLVNLEGNVVQYDMRYKFATFESEADVLSEVSDITFHGIRSRGGERVFQIKGIEKSPIRNLSIQDSYFSADKPGEINSVDRGEIRNTTINAKNHNPVEIRNVKDIFLSGYFSRGGSGDTYATFQGKKISNVTVSLWPCPKNECVDMDEKVPKESVTFD